jgi:hypothetical protein
MRKLLTALTASAICMAMISAVTAGPPAKDAPRKSSGAKSHATSSSKTAYHDQKHSKTGNGPRTGAHSKTGNDARGGNGAKANGSKTGTSRIPVSTMTTGTTTKTGATTKTGPGTKTVTSNPAGAGKATQNSVNKGLQVNITNINYTNTVAGFVVAGIGQFPLTSSFQLDPGDTIVSVGGISCGDSNLALSDMVDQAYQDGNLVMVVRDVNTGELVEVELPPTRWRLRSVT